MVAHAIGLGDQVIMLPYYQFTRGRDGGYYFTQDGLFQDSWERSRATRALLNAERDLDEGCGPESMVPMVQALVRVLDLGQAQTDGDLTAVERRSYRPANGDVMPAKVDPYAALRLVGSLWILWLAWQEAVWFLLVPRLPPLGVLPGTLVVAVAQLLPLLPLNAVMQSRYIRPLNAKAESILAKAARG
jgi:hypothetical protein